MAAPMRTRHVTYRSVAFAGILVILSAGVACVLVGEGRAKAQGASSSNTTAARDRSQDLSAANVCIGCHSPVDGPPLSGVRLGNWLGPNITPDPVSGIGAWSRDDIFRYLRNGNAPGRGQAAGPMAPVVEALQDTPDAAINALVDWLARQPAHRDSADVVSASKHGERRSRAIEPYGRAARDTVSGAELLNMSRVMRHSPFD